MAHHIRLSATGLGLALAVAGCGTASTTHGAPPASRPAAAVKTTPAVAGTGLFRFRVVACGKLTRAERDQAGTNAKYGVVLAIRNTSPAGTFVPQFTVEFLRGSTVDGQNAAGDSGSDPPVGPGQSARVEADMVPSSGAGRPGDTCKVLSYSLYASSSSQTPAATWNAPR
jgi:hypothetical protein